MNQHIIEHREKYTKEKMAFSKVNDKLLLNTEFQIENNGKIKVLYNKKGFVGKNIKGKANLSNYTIPVKVIEVEHHYIKVKLMKDMKDRNLLRDEILRVRVPLLVHCELTLWTDLL